MSAGRGESEGKHEPLQKPLPTMQKSHTKPNLMTKRKLALHVTPHEVSFAEEIRAKIELSGRRVASSNIIKSEKKQLTVGVSDDGNRLDSVMMVKPSSEYGAGISLYQPQHLVKART